jgi:hypothetical protein
MIKNTQIGSGMEKLMKKNNYMLNTINEIKKVLEKNEYRKNDIIKMLNGLKIEKICSWAA